MLIHLHGYLSDDFVGRVILMDTDQTVQALAARLGAWGPDLYPRPVVAAVVSNERGEILELTSTLTEAGLGAGTSSGFRWTRDELGEWPLAAGDHLG